MKKGALPNAARGPAAIRAIVAPFRQKFKQRAGRCSSLRLYAFNAAEDIGITNLGLEPSLPGVALPLIGVTVFG